MVEPGDHAVISWPELRPMRECLGGRPPAARASRPSACSATARLGSGEATSKYFQLRPGHAQPLCHPPPIGSDQIDKSVPSTAPRWSVVPSAPSRRRLQHCGGYRRPERRRGRLWGRRSQRVHAAYVAGAFPVIAVDPVEIKLDAARRLGASGTVSSSGEQMAEAIRSASGGGVDVVIVAVGSTWPSSRECWPSTRGGSAS